MREIKFRAWDKKDKIIREVTGINFINKDLWLKYNENQIVGANFFEVELMQYTSLKDKNGKEIYEGDLFYYHDVLRMVEYREDNASFMATVLKGNKGSCNIYLKDIIESYDGNLRSEVIGNIYENKDLLE